MSYADDLKNILAPATAIPAPLSPHAQRLSSILADEPAETAIPERTVAGTLADTGISVAKGFMGLTEAAVGFADIPTGGAAGKFMAEKVGFRPDDAREVLDTYLSPAQKEANLKVEQAGEGKGLVGKFTDKTIAAIQNPSVIGQTVVESIPLMFGGAKIGQGIVKGAAAITGREGIKAAAKKGLAGAVIGEGLIGAGSAAEGIRQQTDDGLLTGKQIVSALGSGMGTALFTVVGGKIQSTLKIGDIDSAIARGDLGYEEVKKGFVRRLVEGGISEGLLEEMPQSIQEQLWQNYATDKPLDEGVADAASMGLLSGGAMGAGFSAIPKRSQPLGNNPEADIDLAGGAEPLPTGQQPSAIPAYQGPEVAPNIPAPSVSMLEGAEPLDLYAPAQEQLPAPAERLALPAPEVTPATKLGGRAPGVTQGPTVIEGTGALPQVSPQGYDPRGSREEGQRGQEHYSAIPEADWTPLQQVEAQTDSLDSQIAALMDQPKTQKKVNALQVQRRELLVNNGLDPVSPIFREQTLLTAPGQPTQPVNDFEEAEIVPAIPPRQALKQIETAIPAKGITDDLQGMQSTGSEEQPTVPALWREAVINPQQETANGLQEMPGQPQTGTVPAVDKESLTAQPPAVAAGSEKPNGGFGGLATVEEWRAKIRAGGIYEAKSDRFITKEEFEQIKRGQSSQPAQKEITPPESIGAALQRLDNDENYTEDDLADDVEALGGHESAIKAYRQEQEDDRELKGRGDMDKAREVLVSSLRQPTPQTEGRQAWEMTEAEFNESLPTANKAVRYNGTTYESKGEETHTAAVKRLYNDVGAENFDQNKMEVGIITPDGDFLTYSENGQNGKPLYRDNGGGVDRELSNNVRGNIVRKAIAEGKPVPAAVLAEYNLSPAAPQASAPVAETSTPSQSSTVADLLTKGTKKKPHTAFTANEPTLKGVFVDAGKVIHQVKTDGTSAPVSNAIFLKLRKLQEMGKTAAYVPAIEAATKEATPVTADRDDVDGFGVGLNPLQRGSALKSLNMRERYDGVEMVRKEKIRELVAAGKEVSTYEDNVIKNMTRTQFNRANQREQDAHEKKQKEAGKKTVYMVGGYDMGKTGYDYAKHLMANKAGTVKAEAVDTPSAVVAEAKSVASKANLTMKEMKENLVGQVDEAIKDVEDGKMENNDNGRLTFEIPGDGTFDIVEDAKALKLFRDTIIKEFKVSGKEPTASPPTGITDQDYIKKIMKNAIIVYGSYGKAVKAMRRDQEALTSAGEWPDDKRYNKAFTEAVERMDNLASALEDEAVEQAPLSPPKEQPKAAVPSVTAQAIAALRLAQQYATKRIYPDSTPIRELIENGWNSIVTQRNLDAKRYELAEELGLEVEKVKTNNLSLKLKIVSGDERLISATIADIKTWEATARDLSLPSPKAKKKPLRMDGTARPERASKPPAPEFTALHPMAQKKFDDAWESKNADAMIALVHLDNKGLRAEFENRAGVKLPKAVKGTEEAVNEYFAENANGQEEKTARKINFIRNTESSQKLGKEYGKKFGADIEPAGRYLTEKSPSVQVMPGWEEGTVTFSNPLVIDFGGGYQEASNWKRVLSSRYGNKTGKALSQAIVKDGYDGIITMDGKYTSEIVDLTSFNEEKTAEAVADEVLMDVSLLRQSGDRWQYKFAIGSSWMTANTKEDAVDRATTAYNKAPAEERLTRAQRDAKADQDEFALMDGNYGKLSLPELRQRYEGMGGEIAGNQAAGAREFNGNGGRRTGAAVSNEAAREGAAERMRLGRYIAKREEKEGEEKKGLDDFGSKLGGAKKDKQPSLAKEFSDDDLASLPLSKIWPKEDLDAIEDIFIAAVSAAARAEIPVKPRQAYKVKNWVAKVKLLRELASLMENVTREDYMKRAADYRLEGFIAKVELLESLPREQWNRIGKVQEHPDAYSYNGKDTEGNYIKKASPHSMVEIDDKHYRFTTGTIKESFADIKEKLAGEVAGKKMTFQVRGRTGRFFINKEGDPLKRPLKVFADSKEALDYARDAGNYSLLVQEWENIKERENVKETDTRRADNRPRVGADHRKGEDVTPEMFTDDLGFRGVEFGLWVKQGKADKDRQGMLNAAYDALMDMASILNIPPKAVSLDGTLGLGFGSRGSGNASAHYEPDTLVINLTKTRGAGSLGHEFFHALDRYFQMKRENNTANRSTMYITHNPENYYTESRSGMTLAESRFNELRDQGRIRNMDGWTKKEGVRPEVAEAFADLVKILDASPMFKRAAMIDKGKSDGYWSRTLERAARSFENYLIAKMQQNGYHNDYLANVTTIEEFGRDAGRYPYLLADELPPVAEAFDNLFATIQTKETEAGGVILFSESKTPTKGTSPYLLTGIAKSARLADGWSVEVVATTDGLPAHVQAEMKRQGISQVEGVQDGETKTVYLVASGLSSMNRAKQVLTHETFHVGVIEEELTGYLKSLSPGRIEQFKRQFPAYKNSSDLSIANEMLAKETESNLFVKRIIGKINAWLKEHGINLQITKADIYSLVDRALTRAIEQPQGELSTAFSAKNVVGLQGTQEDIDALTAAIERETNRAIPKGTFRLVSLPNSQSEIVDAVSQIFGKRVVGVDNTRPDIIGFNGATIAARPSAIFIEANTPNPAITIFGHELTHLLRKDNPDIFNHLMRVADAELVSSSFQQYKDRLERWSDSSSTSGFSDKGIREEMMADFIGDQMTKQAFWNKVAAVNPGLFKETARVVQRFIRNVLSKLGLKTMGTNQFYRDLESMQEAVADALSEYATRQNEGRDYADILADDSKFSAALKKNALGYTLKGMVDDLKGSPYSKDVTPIELSGGFNENDNGADVSGLHKAAQRRNLQRQLFETPSYGNSSAVLGEKALALAGKIQAGEISNSDALDAFAKFVNGTFITSPGGMVILKDVRAHLQELGYDIPASGKEGMSGLFKGIGAEWQSFNKGATGNENLSRDGGAIVSESLSPVRGSGPVSAYQISAAEAARLDDLGLSHFVRRIAGMDVPGTKGNYLVNNDNVDRTETNYFTGQINPANFDPNNPDIRFSALSSINERMDDPKWKDLAERFVYSWFNTNDPRKRVYAAADKKTAKNDMVTAEELRGKKTAAEVALTREKVIEPMLKELAEAKLQISDQEEYKHALHAPERNQRMREVNAKRTLDRFLQHMTEGESQVWENKTHDFVASHPEGVSFKAMQNHYLDLIDDIALNIAEREEKIMDRQDAFDKREFSEKEEEAGTPERVQKSIDKALEELETTKSLMAKWEDESARLSGMTDEDADTIVTKWQADPRFKALESASKKLDQINRMGIDALHDSGELSDEEYDGIVNGYQHYVPLMRDGFGETTGSGRITGPTGKPLKVAMGSMREVVNIVAHSVQNYQTYVNRKHKAEAGKTLYQFALDNPESGITVEKLAKIPTHDKEGNIVMYPDQKEPDNGIFVKIDGEKHLLEFDTDERTPQGRTLGRFLESIKESNANIGPIMGFLTKVNRYLAAVNTMVSPEFILSNFVRDYQTAFVHLSDERIKQDKGFRTRVSKDIFAAVRGIYQAENGNDSSPMAKEYREFAKEGGKIGWMQGYEKIEDLAKDLERSMKLYGEGHITLKQLDALKTLIASSNTAVENGVRLATYKNLRDSLIAGGKSPELARKEAASVASKLTVDFTQKGKYGPAFNSLYLFANAGIQGNVRMIQALIGSKSVQKIVGGIVVGGFALQLLALAGGDDDTGEPYVLGLPEFVRERNLIIILPGTKGRYISIPMPYGYNGFNNLGAEAANILYMGMNGKEYNALHGALRVATTFANSFNPLSSGTLMQTLSPTITDPIVQAQENKDYTGRNLMPAQNMFGVPKPDSERYWKGVSSTSKYVTMLVNQATGGDRFEGGLIDMSPETLDMLYDTASGSAGRFVANTLSLPFRAIKGELEANQLPVARRVLGQWDDRAISDKYYDAVEKGQIAKQRFDGAETPQAKMEIRQTPEFRNYMYSKVYDSSLSKLRKSLKLAEAQNNQEQVKVIRERMLTLQKSYLAKVK